MKDAWLDRWAGLIAAQTTSCFLPRILELGCGEGRDTTWFAQQGYADLIAVDISSEALAQCAQSVPSAKTLLLLALATSLLAGLGHLGSWKPRLTRR